MIVLKTMIIVFLTELNPPNSIFTIGFVFRFGASFVNVLIRRLLIDGKKRQIIKDWKCSEKRELELTAIVLRQLKRWNLLMNEEEHEKMVRGWF